MDTANADSRTLKDADGATVETVNYTWDFLNRLTQVQTLDASDTVTQTVTYGYDAFGQRVRKTVVEGASTVTLDQRYLYDGLNQVAAVEAGTLQASQVYLQGLGANEVLAQDTIGTEATTTRWALTDYECTVRDVVSSTGALLDHLVYSSFGQIVSQTDASNALGVAYTGQQVDPETGLDYDHARYYDPGTGQFVTQDPLGFSAGDTNLERYTGNGPVSSTDPSGEFLSWVAGAVGAGIGAGVSVLTTTVVTYVRTGNAPTMGQVAGAALSGAVTGGIIGLSAGVLVGDPSGAIVVAGVAGFAGAGMGSALQQKIDNGSIDGQQVLTEAAIGGVASAVTAGVIGPGSGAGLGSAGSGAGGEVTLALADTAAETAVRQGVRAGGIAGASQLARDVTNADQSSNDQRPQEQEVANQSEAEAQRQQEKLQQMQEERAQSQREAELEEQMQAAASKAQAKEEREIQRLGLDPATGKVKVNEGEAGLLFEQETNKMLNRSANADDEFVEVISGKVWDHLGGPFQPGSQVNWDGLVDALKNKVNKCEHVIVDVRGVPEGTIEKLQEIAAREGPERVHIQQMGRAPLPGQQGN